jgi:hypothetical protein
MANAQAGKRSEKVRRILGAPDGLRAVAEEWIVLREGRHEARVALEAGTQHQPDRVGRRCGRKAVERREQGSLPEPDLNPRGQAADVMCRSPRVFVAKAIDDEGTQACSPCRLRKRTSGEGGNQHAFSIGCMALAIGGHGS